MSGDPESAFVLPGGRAVPALSSREMRELDRIAVEETGPTLLQMMENAGRSMAALVIRSVRAIYPSVRVLVLAGPGGNGGGGVCAARHLGSRVEVVEVCLATHEDRLSEATAVQLSLYRRTGRKLVEVEELEGREAPDVVIDALVGYGLRGPARGTAARLIEWANRSGALVLSLDLPSGLDPDTGRPAGVHIRADATLTLHLPKPGLASAAAGALFLADLGVPAGVTRKLGVEAPPWGPAFIAPLRRTGPPRPAA